jgi:hypothetical protein
MEFTVHTLKLHKDIVVAREGAQGDGTIAILEYRSLVGEKDLEPAKDAHLEGDGIRVDSISAGDYLFAQGTLAKGWAEQAKAKPDDETRALFRDCAEAVWLESLWLDTRLKNDRILVRILLEDSKTVFQAFREIIA